MRITFIPAAVLIGFWFVMQLFNAGQVTQHVHGRWGRLPGAYWRSLCLGWLRGGCGVGGRAGRLNTDDTELAPILKEW